MMEGSLGPRQKGEKVSDRIGDHPAADQTADVSKDKLEFGDYVMPNFIEHNRALLAGIFP
jgi:hypothetical protein